MKRGLIKYKSKQNKSFFFQISRWNMILPILSPPTIIFVYNAKKFFTLAIFIFTIKKKQKKYTICKNSPIENWKE